MEYNFEPLAGVGSFRLGSSIRQYAGVYDFSYMPKGSSQGYDSYALDNEGISVFVEEGNIIAIMCSRYLVYKNKNIIGLSLRECNKLFGMEPDGEADLLNVNEGDVLQEVYEYEQIGLQVWLERGVTVTAIAYEP